MWDYDISAIDTQLSQKWINNFSATLSPKTVRNIYGYLISVLSFFGYGKDIDVTLPQKEKVEYHVVTDEELKTLLKATEGTELGIAVALAAFIPARRSEICALTNADIDRVHNTVTINKAKVKNETESFVLKPPKTYGSYRTVELPKSIIDMIPDKPGEIISCTPNGLENQFVRKLNSLNFKFRFHDLRHYGATFLHAQGIPDKYIMQRGGWTSVSTLQNIYTHCLPTETKIASNAVIKKFNSLME